MTIADNMLVDNDKGFETEYGQCFSTPEAPGDCGETIHLVAVTDSTVEGNYVVHNAGGILLTDEFGPTSDNVIRFNESVFNKTTTAGSRSPATAGGDQPRNGRADRHGGRVRQPVESNVSDDNGVPARAPGS